MKIFEDMKTWDMTKMATFLSSATNKTCYEDGDFDPGVMAWLESEVENGEPEAKMLTVEWISVKDRLPDEPEDETQGYLIANADGQVRFASYLREDVCNGERWHYDLRFANDVTHWMPLPEPPEGD